MRGKDLFEKITGIDDKIIVEASNTEDGMNKNKQEKPPQYKKWLAVAACAVIATTTIFFLNSNGEKTDIDLPKLTVNMEFNGGMGFEGFMAYDISDLTNANPWNENSQITHLPVIKNQLTYDEMQRNENPDYELMKKLLKETAENLGMDIENIAITSDEPNEEIKKATTEKLQMAGEKVPEGYFNIGRFFMEDENHKVEIDTSYTTLVNFLPPVKLQSEYNFTYFAPIEDIYKVAQHLQGEYDKFINIKNPVINIMGGDFSYSGQQTHGLSFFEDSQNEVEKFLNYHFNNVDFYGNEKGELFLARKYYTDLSGVIGEYPIIDKEAALKLLEKGNYITTVPEAFQGAEYVRKVELIYRTRNTEKIFMPNYRFYVEMPSMKQENGLNTYGAYYVPAVEGKYIENMPVWDGSFN